MRRTILVGAALAAMGGAVMAGPIAYVGSDGRLSADWKRMKECAAKDPGAPPEVKADVGTPNWAEQYRAQQAWVQASNLRLQCILAVSARLDGWRAAGREGEPPE